MAETEDTFTPGPWQTSDADGVYNGAVTATPGRKPVTIARCPAVRAKSLNPQATARANARLCAAAPDLLAALQALVCEMAWVNEQLDVMPDDFAEAQNKAVAAIAKATGAKQ